jgi:hypothetical protein
MKICIVALLAFSFAIITGCSASLRQARLPSQSALKDDLTYLTPIPLDTLQAYHEGIPLDTKLQAVIAARAELSTTRLNFSDAPKVISVERMKLDEAYQRLDQTSRTYSEGRTGDTLVWLVIFTGKYQIIPPDPWQTVTPGPPGSGCIRIIIDEKGSVVEAIGAPSDCN